MKQKGKAVTLTGLAGAVAVAGASQAYGGVVVITTPANIVGHAPAASDNGTRKNIDFDGDGRTDLSILYRNLTEPGGAFTLSYVVAGTTAVPGSVVGTSLSGSAYAYPLTAGTSISAASPFYQKTGYFGHIVTNYAGTNYGFTTAGTKNYLGFEFVAGSGQTDYAYIYLETDLYTSAAVPGGISFFKAGYETTGAAILAGANATAVPEPGSLASMALGAVVVAGAGLKRRRAARA